MALDFGDLMIDTPGTGTLSFADMPAPKVVRESIFAQQKVLQSAQPPPEDMRRAAVRSLILGKDPAAPSPGAPAGLPRVAAGSSPQAPQMRSPRNPNAAPTVSGYGLLNVLFPIGPQRNGLLVTWHKHWLYLLRGAVAPLLLLGAVLALWTGSIVMGEPGVVGPLEVVLGWAALVLTPVCLIWSLWNWEDWRNDLYRLDHERVYHIESLPFGLREQSKETTMGRISDVMYVVPGPIANLLNYGDVIIKTPGEATEFVFHGIPCPREVQQEIMERVDDLRRKAAAGTDREIEAWLKAYHDVTREP
jgi:hypothetical protein